MKRFSIDGNIEIKSDDDHGFLQSWKYFEDVKEDIKTLFRFKNDIHKKAKEYLSSVRKDGSTVIGIHIRRGDHIELGYLRFPPYEYFEKAKRFFTKKYKKVKFVIATNDKEWVKDNFDLENTEILTHTKTPAMDMAILSLCDGMIMSIGTFSYWAGYLCEGDVIYYKNEFDMSHPVNKGKVKKEDYYPPYWIEM